MKIVAINQLSVYFKYVNDTETVQQTEIKKQFIGIVKRTTCEGSLWMKKVLGDCQGRQDDESITRSGHHKNMITQYLYYNNLLNEIQVLFGVDALRQTRKNLLHKLHFQRSKTRRRVEIWLKEQGYRSWLFG